MLYDEYLDFDFYEVEEINGKKMIRSDGYFYFSNSDDDEPYRLLEYSDLYLDPSELKEKGYVYYDENQAAVKQYIEDLDEAMFIDRLFYYLNNATELDMNMVDDNTPCGRYYGAVIYD